MAVLGTYHLPSSKVIVMGDSGGDGPHFQWAADEGAFSIGIMAKPSLIRYCELRHVRVSRFFGWFYGPGEAAKSGKRNEIRFPRA